MILISNFRLHSIFLFASIKVEKKIKQNISISLLLLLINFFWRNTEENFNEPKDIVNQRERILPLTTASLSFFFLDFSAILRNITLLLNICDSCIAIWQMKYIREEFFNWLLEKKKIQMSVFQKKRKKNSKEKFQIYSKEF